MNLFGSLSNIYIYTYMCLCTYAINLSSYKSLIYANPIKIVQLKCIQNKCHSLISGIN